MRNDNPINVIAGIDLGRFGIAVRHTPLRINPLVVEQMRGQCADFVERWAFIHLQVIA